jgi:hypothetical protein
MSRVRLGIVAALLFAFMPALLSATSGSFRGVIVRGPDENPGWIWVKGANGLLRKVGVNHARVTYDSAVPTTERERQASRSMKSGAEVRVTADQNGDGDWQASRVEILKIKAAEPVIEPSERKLDNVRTSF